MFDWLGYQVVLILGLCVREEVWVLCNPYYRIRQLAVEAMRRSEVALLGVTHRSLLP